MTHEKPGAIDVADAGDDNNGATDTSVAGVAIIDEDMLRGKIHEIRGQKVMLDFELAEIYGYSTTAFNQQVKNNAAKFEGEDFMFQLESNEFENLMSNKLTSSWGGRRKLPFAFTEQGVYMLMTVLRGELATKQSRALVRLFKHMKDRISENQGLLDERDRLRLASQIADNMLDIAVLKRDLTKVEAEVAKVVDELGETVRHSELNGIMERFGEACARDGFLVLDGNPVPAAAFHAAVFACARRNVLVVDDYPGAKTLALLGQVHPGVEVTLFTDNRGRGLCADDIEGFRRNNPEARLELRATGGRVHDRYVFIDYGTDNEMLYHCGASIKDAGGRVTTITRIIDAAEYHPLFERLLEEPTIELD